MSHQPDYKIRGAAEGPYGPDNPPPPPSTRPPQTQPQTRLRSQTPTVDGGQQEWRKMGRPSKWVRERIRERAAMTDSERQTRTRSRSPAGSQDQSACYRERSPLSRDEKPAQSGSPSRSDTEKIMCFACGRFGHIARECPKGNSGAAKQLCYRCGETGHLVRYCTNKAGKTDSAPNPPNAMPNNRGQDGEAKGRNQPRRSRSPVRGRDAQIGNECRPGEAYGYDRDAYDQETEGWASEAGRYHGNDFEYNVGDKSGDAKCWHTYEDSYGQSFPPETRGDMDFGGEVNWDDEALETGAVDLSTDMTMAAEQTKPFVKPRTAKYWQEKGIMNDHGRRPTHHLREVTQAAPEKESKPSNGPGSDAHRKRQKDSYRPAPLEVKPTHDNGLARFPDTGIEPTPITAYDLRGYDYQVQVRYRNLPRVERFRNGGNGKVAPSLYGSEQRHDLGLCFTTFLTRHRCEMGVECPWRHHPLSNTERAWIVEYGRDAGKQFLDNMDRWWSFPEVPVPGASLVGRGE